MSRRRTDKTRVEKTTTGQIRLLLSDTPLDEISDREVAGLAKRHGAKRLLLAADVAAETWRRYREDKHNPGGYLHALCTSIVIPEWYVPLDRASAGGFIKALHSLLHLYHELNN